MKIQKFIIAEKSDINDQEQSIVGWGSKPIPDRDGELIESSAWQLEQYRKNPVLMLSHDYSAPPVGKCLWIKSDANGLKFKAKFANTERGKEIYQLYKDGIMSGFSVGFSINKATDHPSDEQYKSMNLKRVYHDVELLEISCVAIPACPDALIEQVKSGKIKNKELKEEMDHVIQLVDSAKPDGKDSEVHVPETPIVDKPVIDATVKVDAIDPEALFRILHENRDKLAELFTSVRKADEFAGDGQADECKCPAGGVCMEDYGDYEECKDCQFAEKCKAGSEKEEEGEGEDKACGGGEQKPKKPKAKDLSIYDIVTILNQLIVPKGAEKGAVSPYVVDVFPVDYPDGHVIYFTSEGYKKSDYSIDPETFAATLKGIEDVEMNWVYKRYPVEVPEKDQPIEKEDTVIEILDDDVITIVDKSVKQEDLFDFDSDMVKDVLKETFSKVLVEQTQEIVSDTIKKMKGRVV